MSLQALLGLAEAIQIADIGAAAINETPVYVPLLQAGAAHLNAFEGDPRQIEAIRQAYPQAATVFPDFVADGSEQTLYLMAAASGMSSLLKPNAAALAFFNGFERFGEVLSVAQVGTKRLDDIAGLPDIDFLKMDVQGAELAVMQNGLRKLSRCVAVQLEVSWVCLYEGQPAFGEIDTWMRQQGYLPHCFLDIKRWSIAPTIFNGDFRIPGNQLLESDVVYIRNPLALGALDALQLKKLALIAHACFGSLDLCVRLLLELIARGDLPESVYPAYMELVNRQASQP